MKANDRSSQPDEPAVLTGEEPAAVAITPPPELVKQWIAQIWHEGSPVKVAASDLHIATQAARWGWGWGSCQGILYSSTTAEGEVGDALAARPLLEKVARLGDVIGQQTVAQVQQLAEQAAAWLQENPPGQPVAIEPRGCPTPGACSCVEPAPPAPAEGEELSPREAEAQKAFTRIRDCILNEIEGFDNDQINEILNIIDTCTPDWV